MEVGFGFPQGSYGWRRVFPATREPTPEEVQEKEEQESRLEEIAIALEGGEDTALAAEAAAIEQRLAALEAGLNAFAPEDLAIAGAVIWLNPQGTAVIDRGFVRREDEPAPAPQEVAGVSGADDAADDTDDDMGGQPHAEVTAAVAGDGAAAEPEEDSPRPLSERLVEDLTAHRIAALCLALAEQPETALVAVVHALAVRLFSSRSWDPASCFDLQPHEANLQASSDTIQASPAAAAFEAARRRWRARLPGEEAELWDWLLAADPATRLELLAFCAGAVTDATQRRSGQPGRSAIAHADRLASTLGLDLRPCWSPTEQTQRPSRRRLRTRAGGGGCTRLPSGGAGRSGAKQPGAATPPSPGEAMAAKGCGRRVQPQPHEAAATPTLKPAGGDAGGRQAEPCRWHPDRASKPGGAGAHRERHGRTGGAGNGARAAQVDRRLLPGLLRLGGGAGNERQGEQGELSASRDSLGSWRSWSGNHGLSPAHEWAGSFRRAPIRLPCVKRERIAVGTNLNAGSCFAAAVTRFRRRIAAPCHHTRRHPRARRPAQGRATVPTSIRIGEQAVPSR